MDRTRVFALGAGTLAVALGAGLMVQHQVPRDHPALTHAATPETGGGGDLPGRLGGRVVAVAADLDPAGAAGPGPGSMAAMGGIGRFGAPASSAAAPAPLPQGSVAVAALAAPGLPASAMLAVPRLPEASSPAAAERRDCTPALAAEAAPGAMIRLALDAPCLPEVRVVLRHGGLAVTAMTSSLGRLELDLPAMTEAAVVSVALPGPATVSARLSVPEVRDYDRVAVQWQGNDAFQLHAYEFGATHGAPGHVSAAAPAGPDRATGGIGGFLTVLGDSRTDWPLLAEVYSFPAARLAGTGSVELVLEAAITEETCGRPMLGEALEMRRGAPVVAMDIDVVMPGCETVGGYVMLRRLLDDVTLARN